MNSFDEVFFSSLATLDVAPVCKFKHLVDIAVERDAEEFAAQLAETEREKPDYKWGTELRELHFGDLGIIKENLGALCLISLQQLFETRVSDCLAICFPEKDDEEPGDRDSRRARWSTRKIDDRLKVIGIDQRKLPTFPPAEELAEIVNAWKHHGFVTDILASKFPQLWKRGESLGDLEQHFERLLPGVQEHGAALAECLKDHRRRLAAEDD